MNEMIAHFEILDKIGAGGMGIVYRARDTKLGREVALKLLPENLATNPAYLQRFQREARAASALNHPNICTIYEIGEHQNRHFIAMEMLEGQTLRAFIQGKALPSDQIIRIALQIADALESAHSKGIVHRDVKPANIFITNRGHVKVLDFGLAKLASAGRSSTESELSPSSPKPREIPAEYVSTPHAAIGTLPYMSPEQALGEELDARTDLFSLGSVLYEMATGIPAFSGNTQPLLFQEILTKTPSAPIRLNPDLPQKLDDIICKLLEKDRELRHQTAADLCADLKRLKRDLDLQHRISSGTGIVAHARNYSDESAPLSIPDSKPPKHAYSFIKWLRALKRPKLAILSSGAAVLILAFALFLTFSSSSYIPCIEFRDFVGGSESLDAQMIGFVLKRTLSQFPEVNVVDGQEFKHLLTMEKARRQKENRKENRSSLLQAIFPWRWDAQAPAVQISGNVNDSLGLVEVSLDCVVRGKKEAPVVTRFRGVDDLLRKGIDSLVLQTLNRYDSRIVAQSIEGRQANYRTAVQLLSSRWDALPHYYRGAKAWERLDSYSAERELQSALEIDPNFALAHLMLGEVRVFQNQWDAAQSEILAARAQARALTDVDQLRVEAFLARAFGKPFDERVHLQRLRERQPYKREYLYELAESYFHTADVDEAISKYLDALSLDSGYDLPYNHIAYCYAWKGEHALALEACRNYLKLAQSANAYDSLGDAYMLAGDYAKAEEMKTKAVQMDPKIYYASRNLAFIEMLRGQNKAAAERLKSLFAATEDNRNKAQNYAALAFLDYRKGDLEPALKMCERGLEMSGPVQYDAPHDQLIWLIGMIELKRHNLPAARRALGQLLSILDTNQIRAMNYKPAYKYWLHLRAWILAEEGKVQEAAAAINDLKWIRSKLGYWSTPFDLAFFFDAIGQIYEKMKQPAEAEQTYNEALAYNPHFALSRFHLARLLKSRGSYAEARREMELFLKEWQGADPDTAEMIEAAQIMSKLPAINQGVTK
jgi:serine/threonine protein kinase/tetratricopeptide (TPR) repeat protein